MSLILLKAETLQYNFLVWNPQGKPHEEYYYTEVRNKGCGNIFWPEVAQIWIRWSVYVEMALNFGVRIQWISWRFE